MVNHALRTRNECAMHSQAKHLTRCCDRFARWLRVDTSTYFWIHRLWSFIVIVQLMYVYNESLFHILFHRLWKIVLLLLLVFIFTLVNFYFTTWFALVMISVWQCVFMQLLFFLQYYNKGFCHFSSVSAYVLSDFHFYNKKGILSFIMIASCR